MMEYYLKLDGQDMINLKAAVTWRINYYGKRISAINTIKDDLSEEGFINEKKEANDWLISYMKLLKKIEQQEKQQEAEEFNRLGDKMGEIKNSV